jgi:alpha-amylase
MVQDEETGSWYQHRGRDFKVPLADYLQGDGNIGGTKRSFDIWKGSRNYYIVHYGSLG